MAAEVHYREATREDLPGIAEIFLAAFPKSVRHYVGREIEPRVIIDVFAIALDSEPGAFLMAEVEGKVAGYIFSPAKFSDVVRAAILRSHLLKIFGRWIIGRYGIGLRPAFIAVRNWLSIWREAREEQHHAEARILSIAVSPQHQGLGIGTGLTRLGLEYLRECGEKTVRLEVRPDNLCAIHVYEKLGFQAKGRTKDTQGEWLIMLCDLSGDGDA